MTLLLYAMTALRTLVPTRSALTLDKESDGARCSSVLGRPLDALEVHALLGHLVERGHLPELLGLGHDELARVVDLLVRREAPEAEPDARVGELLLDGRGGRLH